MQLIEEDLGTLRSMVLSFRISELQKLLDFAGKGKNGRKDKLQKSALNLLNAPECADNFKEKIRELYGSIPAYASQSSSQSQQQQQQQAVRSDVNRNHMNPGGGYSSGGSGAGIPYNNIYHPMNAVLYGSRAGASSQDASMMHQQRGGYGSSNYGSNNAGVYSPYNSMSTPMGGRGGSISGGMGGSTIPIHPDVKFIKLPFYDTHGDLLKPASLMPTGNMRLNDAQFQFFLTPKQATDVASNRDIMAGSQVDYLYQIQMRFAAYSTEPGKELHDEFPPSIQVFVNNKPAQLPNPIPTNKPGVDPKRPPRPVNITGLCKLSPILSNNVVIKWATEIGRGWVVGIWLVEKLTSSDLLGRLKTKGISEPSVTKRLISSLTDDDEVASTMNKVSVACPLGKMRMTYPARPSTCKHLQCFDAMLFLQMNERKPTWNCPVCDTKALYDNLYIDGYFMDILESKELPKDEKEIIIEADATWKPVPKEDEKTKPPSSMPPAETANGSNGNGSSAQTNGDSKEGGEKPEEEVVDLSSDEETETPAPPSANPPLPPGGMPPLPPGAPPGGQPPLPPPGFGGQAAPPPPPPGPPGEVECIDLD